MEAFRPISRSICASNPIHLSAPELGGIVVPPDSPTRGRCSSCTFHYYGHFLWGKN